LTADLEQEGNLSAGVAILEMSERQKPDTSAGIRGFCLGKGYKINKLSHDGVPEESLR
jgi:hypothetical protein